jgi:acetylornithine deacetylase/succinyl-diaminopimelate desuccinylase-like protein
MTDRSSPRADPDARTTAAIERSRSDADAALATLEQLVTIPSVSAEPAPSAAVTASADAVADVLRAAGLEHVHLTSVDGSHPYVVGDWVHHDDRPTVLLYAHHDVQPPGVVANWESDPFTPRRADGRLYGRGSADDKAGAVAHAAAVAAWLRTAGELPCNVRVLVEGEEEIGSPHLGAFLAEQAAGLASDVLVLADAGNWKVGTPGVTWSLRGLASLDVTVRALHGPVHSGMAGGVVPDPVQALTRALASLVDDHGDIAVVGFTDDVRPLTDDERQRLALLPGDDDGVRRSYGVVDGADLVGSPSRSVWERLWFRPALTVIGFDAHPIAGSSNQVIAAASARLSMRLAPGQDPARAVGLVADHVRAHVPWHLEVTTTAGEAAPAWVCEPRGWAFDAADRALRAGFGTEPVYMGVGGSIPFVGPFADAFGGIPSLLLGPADPTSAIHGENESLHLGDWQHLIESEIHLLAELASAGGPPAT